MYEKKNRICSVLLSLLCSVMLLASVMPCIHSAEAAASITLVCAQEDVKVSDMSWKIYKVGERRSGQFTLTGEFAQYPVDMSRLSEENVRGIAQALECFIIGDRIKALGENVTDSDGNVVFEGLDKGLYLAVAKSVLKEPITYMATPLLFEIKEDGSAEKAFPKIYSIITLSGEGISYTVKKVWIDNDDSFKARPVNVTVDLFKDGELYDTVVLDEASDWEHTWKTLDSGAEWRAVERNIPVNYAVLVDYNSKQFLIKNSYAPDIFIDGGEYTKTTASAVTTATTSTAASTAVTTTGSGLPQTGQLWWPVFPLALGGITLICIGLLTRKKNSDEK